MLLGVVVVCVMLGVAFAEMIGLMSPVDLHVGMLALLLSAVLLVAFSSSFFDWKAHWGFRAALAAVLLLGSAPHYLLVFTGCVTASPMEESFYFLVQLLWNASFALLLFQLLRERDADEVIPSRGVRWAIAVAAVVIVATAGSSTFDLGRKRDRVRAACAELEVGVASSSDVERVALSYRLDRPKGALTPNHSLWLAPPLVGVMGWQCSVQLERDRVVRARAEWLVLD